MVDFSAGTAPRVTGAWLPHAPVAADYVAVAYNHLIVSGGQWMQDMVQVYGLSDPESPSLRSTIRPGGPIIDFSTAGRWLAWADSEGVVVLDLADATAPSVYARWPKVAKVQQVAASDQVVYAAVSGESETGKEWQELVVLPLTPGILEVARRVDVCTDRVEEMVIAGDAVQLLCKDEGLVVVDIRRRLVPVVSQSSGPLGRLPRALALRQAVAFVGSLEDTPPGERGRVPQALYGGLHVVSASAGGELRSTGVYTTPLGAGANGIPHWGIAAIGKYALLGYGDPVLRVVDVSDPSTPRQVQEVPVQSPVGALAQHESLVYAAGQRGGMYVFRVDVEPSGDRPAPAYLPTVIRRR